ncbi:MAG: cytochrome c biogenesis CcdA family protein [Nakamurella sp.]
MTSPVLLAAGSVTDTVESGPFLVAAALALAAGVVSFASPCVLPLVPGYLSYLVGLVGAEEANAGGARSTAVRHRMVRGRAVRGAALFVGGFTVVFLAESLLVLGLSRFLVGNQDLLTRIGGVVTIIVGLAMLGWIRPMQREVRIHARPTGRITGAPLLGAFFALGWTACLGPTLAGVQSLAISSSWNGNAWRGLFLVVLYCLGLGIPFLLLAFGFGWATNAMGALRRHSRVIQIVGAVALIAIGLLMVTGAWGHFISWMQYRYVDVRTVL